MPWDWPSWTFILQHSRHFTSLPDLQKQAQRPFHFLWVSPAPQTGSVDTRTPNQGHGPQYHLGSDTTVHPPPSGGPGGPGAAHRANARVIPGSCRRRNTAFRQRPCRRRRIRRRCPLTLPAPLLRFRPPDTGRRHPPRRKLRLRKRTNSTRTLRDADRRMDWGWSGANLGISRRDTILPGARSAAG